MLESFISNFIAEYFGKDHVFSTLGLIVTVTLLILLAFLLYIIVRLVVGILLNHVFTKIKSPFIKILTHNKVFNLLAHLSAGTFLCSSSQFITNHTDMVSTYTIILLNKLSQLYIFFTIVLLCSKLIWSLNSYYEKKFKLAKEYPIYTYLKVAVFFVWVISGILIISFFANTSPWALLTGIGAVSAFFLLVFKDTLLGIISSIQAAAFNVIRIGDRICIDKYGLDGVVFDISINTIKIRNADNTVSNIPTYMIMSEIVKNWRFMEESGARRIKSAIYLDAKSIKVCSEDLLVKLQTIPAVKNYLESNPQNPYINLALFRIYLVDYLTNNIQIDQEQTILVRHLEAGIGGLPLEIYAFSSLVSWVDYEMVQADVLEHAYAMLGMFELELFHPRISG